MLTAGQIPTPIHTPTYIQTDACRLAVLYRRNSTIQNLRTRRVVVMACESIWYDMDHGSYTPERMYKCDCLYVCLQAKRVLVWLIRR